MTYFIAVVLLCVAVIILGVAGGRPYGWLAMGLAVVALICACVGLPVFHR